MGAQEELDMLAMVWIILVLKSVTTKQPNVQLRENEFIFVSTQIEDKLFSAKIPFSFFE